MTKSQIRNIMKEERNKLSVKEQKDLSKAILIKLLNSSAYQYCDYLFSFVSFQKEVNTHEIIRQSLKEGKIVYVPRVELHGMEFYEIINLDNLVPSKFGVPEPVSEGNRPYKGSLRIASHNDFNPYIMLLPGLAFDSTGNRIGYGAGYYDKYLSNYPKEHFYKIALAYDFQVLKEIPADELDIKADMIITPTKVIECKR